MTKAELVKLLEPYEDRNEVEVKSTSYNEAYESLKKGDIRVIGTLARAYYVHPAAWVAIYVLSLALFICVSHFWK